MTKTDKHPPDDQPQVFSVKCDLNGDLRFSRRDFLKAAGAAAAGTLAAGAGIAQAQDEFPMPNARQLSASCRDIRVHSARSMAISPDGTLLVSGGWGDIKLWSLPSGELLQTLTQQDSSSVSVAISPDGTLLASAHGDTIHLWSLPDGELLQTLTGHISSVQSVTIVDFRSQEEASSAPPPTLTLESSANINMRSGPGTGYTVIGALETGQHVVADGRNQAGDWVHLQWEQSGDTWAYAPLLTLVDDAAADSLLTLEVRAEVGESGQFNGVMLISGGGRDDMTINLWSLPDGTLLRTLRGHEYSIWSLAASPDKTLLASGSGDGTIRLWALPGGEPLQTLTGQGDAHSLAISPDGTLLVSGWWNEVIRLWALPSGELLQTLRKHANSVYSVAISPDGTLLASGGWDETIRLWSLPDGELLRTLSGHDSEIRSIVFSPDGTLLVSGSINGIIRLWSLPEAELQSCLIDPEVSQDADVIQIQHGDRTYYIPPGGMIPSEAVCMCNTVALCSCVGHRCSCVGHCSCAGHGVYWYPN